MPFLKSRAYGYFNSLSEAELTTLKTTLATAKCRLYTAAAPGPNPRSAVADFTEATFGGYGEADLTDWVGPVTLPSTAGLMIHSEADFAADDTITPPGETVLGYYIVNAAGDEVLYGEQFVNPVNFVLEGDNLSLDVIFGLPFGDLTDA